MPFGTQILALHNQGYRITTCRGPAPRALFRTTVTRAGQRRRCYFAPTAGESVGKAIQDLLPQQAEARA